MVTFLIDCDVFNPFYQVPPFKNSLKSSVKHCKETRHILESIVLARHMRLAGCFARNVRVVWRIEERNYQKMASLVISSSHANASITFKIIEGTNWNGTSFSFCLECYRSYKWRRNSKTYLSSKYQSKRIILYYMASTEICPNETSYIPSRRN